MLTRLMFIALCLLTGTSSVDTITKTLPENDGQFAARYAPNTASTMVHVASARVGSLDSRWSQLESSPSLNQTHGGTWGESMLSPL